ncbi:MAG: CdaR family protein [Myxococcota bacterium]|jgi:YbbR domain-containing protein|nr:CdaR family protein [Myxococcota bacterium]
MSPIPASILAFIKESFTENVGLKALSLGLAVGLFAFLYGQQDEQQRTVEVGVVTRPPPEDANRELMTQMPPTIHVTLRGPARALDELNQARIPPVEIDLRQGHRKQIVFDPSMFSVEDARITIIDPPSIDLDWEDVISRQIPVQASISGQPASGYVIKGEPEVDPPTITVRGPTSLIEVMQFARLAPFDVSGLSEGTHRRRIAIDAPPSRVRFIGPTSAAVSVVIARRLSEAKFENRPVEVVGVVGATVVPRTVDVTVVGPPEIVRALKADQVVPRADLTAIPELNLTRHGTAVVKLSVELVKAEAEIQPPSVNVRF